MNISIKNLSGRYIFSVNNKDMEVFACDKHYFLVPYVKSSYKYAIEAYRDGKKLIDQYSYHIAGRDDMVKPVVVDLSAEEMLLSHYEKIMKNLRLQIDGMKKERVSDTDKEKIHNEAKMIKSELKTLAEKITEPKDRKQFRKYLSEIKSILLKTFGDRGEDEERDSNMSVPPNQPSSLPPSIPPVSAFVRDHIVKTSNIQKIDQSVIKDLLEDYAIRACKSIQNIHKGAIFKINGTKEIVIYDASCQDDQNLLRIEMNDSLNIDSIVPLCKISEIYPYHSVEFYQRYWKPIVEALGHFYLNDFSVLLPVNENSLPDVTKSESVHEIDGWDTNNNVVRPMQLSFCGKRPIWVFNIVEFDNLSKTAQNQSRYIEQDYLNAIVICIDEKLDSIFSRTGFVVQVIPRCDMVEIDVDFGRGIGIVRLSESQLKVVPVEK